MDHNLVHLSGTPSIPSPSPHRLPTVSAAQALSNLKSKPRCISTGLASLDCDLQNRELVISDVVEPIPGGISRGKVTEVYGPPGVGKTALGMQLAASALHAGEGVLWVDASHPVPGTRLAQILSAYQPLVPSSSPIAASNTSELVENLTHYSTPTLAYLIALLTIPTPAHPPPNTALIIIDSFSILLSNAFPKSDVSSTTKKPGAPNPMARKSPIVQHIINALQRLAATRNIAIVILSQCMTKMRSGLGAALVPAISTTAWEDGISCRVALFRDWGWEDEDGRSVADVRLAQVIRAEGVAVSDSRPRLVGFSICETGLIPLTLPTHQTQPYQSAPLPKIPLTHNDFAASLKNAAPITPKSNSAPHSVPQKRKADFADLEIPDSDAEDDEDYGWGEEDEEVMPPPPPQWQGSEDILIPDPRERELAENGNGEGDGDGDGDGEEGDLGAAEKEAERMERVIEDSEDELA